MYLQDCTSSNLGGESETNCFSINDCDCSCSGSDMSSSCAGDQVNIYK